MVSPLLDFLGALLTRPRCALCGEPAPTPACPACSPALPWLEAAPQALSPAASLLVFAAWEYDEPVSQPIHQLKYQDRPDLAERLVQVATPAFDAQLASAPDALVPVPLHPQRLAQRGYNQSVLLARALKRHVPKLHANTAVLPRALRRVANTGQLVGKSRDARWRDTRSAFIARSEKHLVGRRVLLVDDVVTTGATSMACAAALERVGARVQGVLALCRTNRALVARTDSGH